MRKNTAGQKWVVFAFNRNTNIPVTGDAAQITANLRIDGGSANAIDDINPTELGDGYYVFDITQAESNGDYILISPTSSTSDVQVMGCPVALDTNNTVSEIIEGITDGSYDLQEMVRIGFAVLAGIGSGGGTSTVTYKDPTGTKNRIVATVDEDGNRAPISYDGS